VLALFEWVEKKLHADLWDNSKYFLFFVLVLFEWAENKLMVEFVGGERQEKIEGFLGVK